MASCRIGFASVFLALTAVVAAAQIEPTTVVVTNTTMVVRVLRRSQLRQRPDSRPDITGNEIENPQGSAIQIGPEAVRAADVQFLRPIVYDDVLIRGNTITVTDTAVSIAPSVDGVSGTRSRKLVIEKNTIIANTGVRATTAHRFSPPMFGDDNLIDGLTISQNTFDTSGSAIQVFAADYGNSNNRTGRALVLRYSLVSAPFCETTKSTRPSPS